MGEGFTDTKAAAKEASGGRADEIDTWNSGSLVGRGMEIADVIVRRIEILCPQETR